MRQTLVVFLMISLLVIPLGCQRDSNPVEEVSSGGTLLAKNGGNSPKAGCATIQDGTILNSAGQVIGTGYDEWGYNYQARMFNGGYCDAYRDADWCQEYKDVQLIMKWNDAWLDNKDCDGDGKLDRHNGFDSYKGSGAWLTNHMSGGDKKDKWTYFVKIVAVPSDATLSGGVWYAADGTEIGPTIWGEFAIIQELETGSGAPLLYKSPVGPGFGKFKPGK